MQLKKALITAGAVGALGVAGSFGTYAAFTDQLPAQESQFKTGTVEVTGGFNMPDLSSLGTQEPARAGSMTIENTGTEPVHVYVDWDGPVGTLQADGVPGPGNAVFFSDNVLAENILVDSSYQSDFHLHDDNIAKNEDGDAATRLWKINDRTMSPLRDIAAGFPKTILQPGQSKTIYFRVRLREQGPNAWGQNADDNVMQGQAINETLKVAAIEAGSSTRGLPAGAVEVPQGDLDYDGYADNGDKGL
jgi:predicted ribosomally synthesized peptide with SipW-like signal peptide